MSIEDVTSYQEIYSGNLTDKDMKYLDDLGVEWRGRNILEIRDDFCIKIMGIFSQVYQQIALTNPTALPQLKAEIIQLFEDLFATKSEDEGEPSSLVYHFDPITGTYREVIAAEGFFRNCRKLFIPSRKHIKQAITIQQKITKPITKIEEKVVEWTQEHPVAATVIGVAVVVTLVATLGPAGGPACEAVVEAVSAAGAAAGAAALTSEESNKDHADKNKHPDSSLPPPGEAPRSLKLNLPNTVSPTASDLNPIPNQFVTTVNHTSINTPSFNEGLTHSFHSTLQTEPVGLQAIDSMATTALQIKPQESSSLSGRVASTLKDISSFGVSLVSDVSHGLWNVLCIPSPVVSLVKDFIDNKIINSPSNLERQSPDQLKADHTKIDEFFGTNLAYKYDPNFHPLTENAMLEIPYFSPGGAALAGRVGQIVSLDANTVRTGNIASEVIKDISTLERAGLVTQEGISANSVGLLESKSTPVAQVARYYPDPKFAAQLEKQLENHGAKSILKSHNSIKQLLDEHKQKLPGLEFKSSVEREISTFEKQLETLAQFSKENKISLE